MVIKLATFTRASRKADRSVSMAFTTTTEQTVQELAELDAMHNSTCLVAIKPEETPFLNNELKDLDSVDMDLEDTTKSPAKRLRNVLYLVNKKNLGRKPTDQEVKDFYKAKMENIITYFKNKLD